MRGLALVVVLAVAAPAAAADTNDAPRTTEDIEKARGAVLTDDYQPELPGSEIDVGSDDGGATGSGAVGGPHQRRIDERGEGRNSDSRSRMDNDTRYQKENEGSSLFTFLMWGVIIVGLALLVFWLASELIKYGGDDAALAAEPKPSESMVDMAVIERPLGDAEELAARGEYREAIHTLLLRTLQELVRSSAVRVGAAMTSREILARVPLLADARDALHALIITVELTHFGGDDATEEDYLRCRAQFQKFATAFKQSSARAGTGTSIAGSGAEGAPA